MLYLLTEKEYLNSPWCQRSLRGLHDECRKKRLTITQVSDISEIPASDERTAVLLLGSSDAWLRRCVLSANAAGHHPISLTNRVYTATDASFSSVTMDLRDAVLLAVRYLHSLGRFRLALYGVNPLSASDPGRALAFSQATGRGEHIFRITTSLDDMFTEFLPRLSDYDAVICASDYAAISLVQHLRSADTQASPYIVGFGDMNLSRMSTPSITSISDDYENFGRCAVSIYNLIMREEYISTVNIQLHSRLHVRDTTENRPYCANDDAPNGATCEQVNLFYNDEEFLKMSRLEALLDQSDDTDIAIIKALATDLSYAQIAQECFVSETAVKYRIKKIKDFCGIPTRAKLREYLKNFI